MNFIRSQGKELFAICSGISIFYQINTHLISANRCEGLSMWPTINHPSALIVDRILYKHSKKHRIERGSIVVATSPVDQNIDICKRVKYLEGEVTQYGQVVPKNHIWLEGDNSNHSFDSRHHGPVPIQLIKGKVVFSLLPFRFFR